MNRLVKHLQSELKMAQSLLDISTDHFNRRTAQAQRTDLTRAERQAEQESADYHMAKMSERRELVQRLTDMLANAELAQELKAKVQEGDPERLDPFNGTEYTTEDDLAHYSHEREAAWQ
jgi:hypothetical protein